MQGTTCILENHVHILKYFIQLKYYTVNCLQRACVSACVCVRVSGCVRVCVRARQVRALARCFQNSNNSQLHNGQNRRVCMEMPMVICLEFAIVEDGWNSNHFHKHVGYTWKCRR